MKQEYQSAYRKLNADPAFRDHLVRTLEEQQEPRRTRPRWMVPVALAACLILLFGLGVPTIKRVLQPIETVSSAPTANEGVILGSDGLYRDSEITNILCLCTDDGGDGNALMLVSVDQRGGGFKLSSFLPSLRVKTSDDREQALSALFQTEKNGDEAVSLIQQNFGLAVDGYLWIDASDMEAAINAIGGLTMELSEEEAAYFALSSSQDSFLEGGFTAGEHTLTGSQALFFTRVRMGTDYDRMIRQQKLVESLLRQIWNDPSSASEFLGALLPKVRTNLSLPTAMEFASELESFPGNFLSTHTVPADDPDAGGGATDDLSAMAQELIAFVYGSNVQQTGVIRGEDGLYRDAQIVNILLWVGAEDSSASSVMLLSFDNTGQALRLVDFAPGLAIQVPVSGEQPIGEVGAEPGSGALLCTAVEETFGVAIDGYVRAGYPQAVEAIDRIGGVPMSAAVEISAALSETSGVDGEVAAGPTVLSGEEIFAALQLWEGSDSNMGNHEVVLLTLMQQTQESEPDALAADLAPLLETDISETDLSSILKDLPDALATVPEICQVPMDFTGQAVDGGILYADLPTCAQGLAQFLYDIQPEEKNSADVIPEEASSVGNTNSNLANGGIAVDGGDGSVYYINAVDNNRIYRWDSVHNTQTALTDGPCLSLNILNGDLYFINQLDGGIYCLPAKWNLTIPISVEKQPHSDLIVTDEFLYYIRGGEIYQRETRPVTDGSNVSEETLLPRVGGNLLDIQWDGGKLYYFVQADESSPDGSPKIAMYHDGGEPDFLFSNDSDASQPYILDGSALYYAENGNIHRATPDGADAVLFTVSDLVLSQYRTQPDGSIINAPAIFPDVESFAVADGTMYLSTNRRLYCVNLRALEEDAVQESITQVLPATGTFENLCLTEESLYFMSDGETGGVYWQTFRMPLSGEYAEGL